MDIGKFKSSRGRLILWVLIPPVLIAGIGLSTYALRMRSEWQLTRAQRLAVAFPRLVESRENAIAVQQRFRDGDRVHIDSEDELISFVQESAQKAGFTVDSLTVERRAAKDGALPSLVANVQGAAELNTIYNLLVDISSGQKLLSESEFKISRSGNARTPDQYRAEISFELVLFSMSNPGGRL